MEYGVWIEMSTKIFPWLILAPVQIRLLPSIVLPVTLQGRGIWPKNRYIHQEGQLPLTAMVTRNRHGNPPQPGGGVIVLTSLSLTGWRILVRRYSTSST